MNQMNKIKKILIHNTDRYIIINNIRFDDVVEIIYEFDHSYSVMGNVYNIYRLSFSYISNHMHKLVNKVTLLFNIEEVNLINYE